MNEQDSTVTIRPATDADAVLFWRLWTDIETQRFTNTPRLDLPWEEHLHWFARQIDGGGAFVIEEEEGPVDDYSVLPGLPCVKRPVGIVRFDDDGGDLWVSIVLDPATRGRHIGRRALNQVAVLSPGRRTPGIWARIHRLNAPSIRAFEAAGYVCDRADGVWLIYVWRHTPGTREHL